MLVNINIEIEKLDFKTVLDFFLLTINDFPDLSNKSILEMRVKKLSNFANFVTCRTVAGEVIGMIAFYTNYPPLCYITHVSILNGYKGQGLFGKMCDFLEQKVAVNGYVLMRLEVLKSNTFAIKSYRNRGFEIVDDNLDEHFYMIKQISL